MSKTKTKPSTSKSALDAVSKVTGHHSSQASHLRNEAEACESISPLLVFHCQLAHGSPTGVISGFSNVRELYQKIAECYDISPKDILFCTLNTHKIDVKHLLSGQLGLDDLIFAHVHGQPKVVEMEKAGDALGLTITDNGAGLAFIKAINKKSIMGKVDGIYVGDHIEKIDELSVIGRRHVEVAKILREIPNGRTFKLRLIEPRKSGFSEIGSKADSLGGSRKSGFVSGKGTLRLRAKGPATVEKANDVANVAVEKVNALLGTFLGISDLELAQSIWEVGCERKNPSDFAHAIRASDLNEFAFTEEFIFDLWGAVSDAKQGRLKGKTEEFQEKF